MRYLDDEDEACAALTTCNLLRVIAHRAVHGNGLSLEQAVDYLTEEVEVFTKNAAEAVTIYTNAPVAYDYPSVVSTMFIGESKDGKGMLRQIIVESNNSRSSADYQIGRYRSGLYLATEDRDVASLTMRPKGM